MKNKIVFLNAAENVKKGTKDTLSEFEGTQMLYSPVIWVADTNATCHITNNDEATVPSRKADARLGDSMNDSLDASSNKMRHTAQVDIKGSVYSKGKRTLFILKECRFGASKFDLCSLSKLSENGWTMVGDRKGVRLRKDNNELHFDIHIRTAGGRLWAIQIDRRAPDNGPNKSSLATPTTMNLEIAHSYCGHNNIQNTKKIARHLGWRLTRTLFHRCEACAVAKAKQTNLGKGETNEPKQIGELWYVNGTHLKNPKFGKRKATEKVHFPANNCLTLAVEHKTGAVLHSWTTTKTGFIDTFCRYLHHLANTNKHVVKWIRCDDGKENLNFQIKVNGEQWKTDVQFEFIAKTPQRNSRVETKIYNICNKTRASLEAANILDRYRYVLFVLFSKWCAQTDMLEVMTVDGVTKTKHEFIYGERPQWTAHM